LIQTKLLFLIFSLFYLSFFIAVSGLFILSGYGIRKSIIKNKALSILFKKSFKQGHINFYNSYRTFAFFKEDGSF